MPEVYTETPLLGPRFDAALLLATEHHRRQLRKGTEVPYAAHLLAVASLVLEMGGSEDEAIGALLHDLVEDGGGPAGLATIRERFGEDVARIVLANSDTDEEPKPPWEERKRAYIESIAHKAPDELRVSLADKLHNARSILLDFRSHGDELWTRFKAGEGWPSAATTAACSRRSTRAATRSARTRRRRSTSWAARSPSSTASPAPRHVPLGPGTVERFAPGRRPGHAAVVPNQGIGRSFAPESSPWRHPARDRPCASGSMHRWRS
jgi:GTP pyrophosphokinase